MKSGFSIHKRKNRWEVRGTDTTVRYIGRYRTKLDAANAAIRLTKEYYPGNVEKVWEGLEKWAIRRSDNYGAVCEISGQIVNVP